MYVVIGLMVFMSPFQTLAVGCTLALNSEVYDTDLRVSGSITGNIVGRGIGAFASYFILQLYFVDFAAMMIFLISLEIFTAVVAFSVPYDTTAITLDTGGTDE